jgi:hypothetical protein
MYELSLVELDSELAAELPTRNLMRRKGASAHAKASFGSASNANATYQVNFNPQIVINNGTVGGAGIRVSSFNRNNNSAIQNALPINFGIGGN